MKNGRGVFSLISRFFVTFLASSVGWILFVYGQQWNYRNKDQLYLLGTNAAYGIVFVFLFITFWMVASLFSYRNHPKTLKNRFIWFAIFYIFASPFVILSFDSYVSLTKRGIQYNSFFSYEGNHIVGWDKIEKVELDYEIKKNPTKTHHDLRLRFWVILHNNERFDLNHPNSPLYSKEHFLRFFNLFQKAKVPVKVMKPLPAGLQPDSSFYYQLFQKQPKQRENY